MKDQPNAAPEIANYFLSTLEYCPTEGAFYVKADASKGRPPIGELNGVLVSAKKVVIPINGRSGHLIRAGSRHGRKAISAAKLAWFFIHNEWPYFIGHRYGEADIRVMALHAIMTQAEYQTLFGSPAAKQANSLYWTKVWSTKPELPSPECQVEWYPGHCHGQ